MKLGVEVGLSPGHIVSDGDSAPLPQRHSPQFSAYVCCGQTAGWIKMPIGREVGLSPGHIVLDGDPQKKGHSPPPHFSAGVCCGQWLVGEMPLGTKVSLGPGHIVLDGDPAVPIKAHSPNFQPMSIVTKQSPISATAEHLLILIDCR